MIPPYIFRRISVHSMPSSLCFALIGFGARGVFHRAEVGLFVSLECVQVQLKKGHGFLLSHSRISSPRRIRLRLVLTGRVSMDACDSVLLRASGLFGPQAAKDGVELPRPLLGPSRRAAARLHRFRRACVSEQPAGIIESPHSMVRPSDEATWRFSANCSSAWFCGLGPLWRRWKPIRGVSRRGIGRCCPLPRVNDGTRT